jgi:hypothetical protein
MTGTFWHRIATPDDARGIFSVLAEVALEIPVSLDSCGRQKAIFSKVKECVSTSESLVAIDGDERVIGFLLVEPDKTERFFCDNMALHLPYGGVTASWRKQGVFPVLIRQVMNRMVPLTVAIKAANLSEMASRLSHLGFQNAGPGSFPDETNFRWQPNQAKLR